MFGPRWRWAYVSLSMAFLMMLGGIFLSLWWSVGWGIFVLGVGTLGFVVPVVIMRVAFLKCAHHADGIVVAHQKGPEGWYLMVRYTLPDGQEITFQSQTSYFGIRKSLPVSTQVGVLYDPDYPEWPIIDRTIEKFGPYAVAPVVVAMMGFIGFIIVKYAPH